MKPTWGTISTEGVGRFSISADTPGFYARTVDDMELLSRVFQLPAPLRTTISVAGAKIAFIKTHIWPNAGPGTVAAWNDAQQLLANAGAHVLDVSMPDEFARCAEWREIIVSEEARAAFMPSTSKQLKPSPCGALRCKEAYQNRVP